LGRLKNVVEAPYENRRFSQGNFLESEEAKKLCKELVIA